MSFFAFFPPRLVAQTRFLSIERMRSLTLFELPTGQPPMKRNIYGMSIHAELQITWDGE